MESTIDIDFMVKAGLLDGIAIVHDVKSCLLSLTQGRSQLDGDLIKRLEVLHAILSSNRYESSFRQSILEIHKLLLDVILPVDQQIVSTSHMVHISIMILQILYKMLSISEQDEIVELCSKIIMKHDIDSSDYEYILPVLTLLSKLIVEDQHMEKTVDRFHLYSTMSTKIFELFSANDHIVGHVMGLLLIPLFEMNCITTSDIWELIQKLHEQYGQKTYLSKQADNLSERPMFILCGAADCFFAVSGFPKMVVDIMLSKDEFWTLFQCGFYNNSSLTRKRTMYLLKRILDVFEKTETQVGGYDNVFFWKTDSQKFLSKAWEDFILLMETLEEKQVHVIRPLMSKLLSLIEYTKIYTGNPYIHASWLTVVFQRIASHESSYIQRWGMTILLDIDLTQYPLLHQDRKFFMGPFISMLTESSIFHKPGNVSLGACSPIVNKLNSFLLSAFKALKDTEQGEFFRALLQRITGEFWSEGVFVYVAQAFSKLPQSPVWTEQSIPHIRYLLNGAVRTMDVQFRGAIQHYIMHASINLLSMDCVSILDVQNIISCLRFDESLRRGTTLWQAICDWLIQTSSTNSSWNASSLLNHITSEIQTFISHASSENNFIGEEDFVAVSRFLLLATDAGLLTLPCSGENMDTHSHKTAALELSLKPIIDVIKNVNYHAYMLPEKAERAMFLLAKIVEEASPIKETEKSDWTMKCIRNCVNDVLGEILLFTQRQISEFKKLSDIERCEEYASVITRLLAYAKMHVNTQIQSLVSFCIKLSKRDSTAQPTVIGQLHRYFCLLILGSLCEADASVDSPWQQEIIEFVTSMDTSPNFCKPVDLEADNSCQEFSKFGVAAWGKVSSRFLSFQWKLIHHYLQHVPQNSAIRSQVLNQPEQLAHLCIEVIDLMAGSSLDPLFQCVQLLIPQISEDLGAEIILLVWYRIQELVRTGAFWDSYPIFINILCQPHVLLADEGSSLNNCLTKVTNEIFVLGEEKKGVVNLIIEKLTGWWLQNPKNIAQSCHLVDIFVKGLVYGEIHSKGKRYLNEVRQYLLSLGNELSVNQLLDLSSKDDMMVRVGLISFLSLLKPEVAEHATFAKVLIAKLVDLQKEYQDVKGYRNFPNSLSHRQKHRVLCGLLLLEPFFEMSEMLPFLLDLLITEVQPSVRCNVEWLLIRLMHHHPSYQTELWKLLEKFGEKKPIFLCSLMTIVAHLSKLIEDPSELEYYLLQAIPFMVTFGMSHHFNTRTFAQATLITLWRQAEKAKLDSILSQHAMVSNFIGFWTNSKQASKTTQKLLENFFFAFHPLRDYSIESIVVTMPYLTLMCDEEWLPLNLFLKLHPLWSTSDHSLPLHNPSSDLRDSLPGMWRVKHTENAEESEDVYDGDVQKKIIPWKYMMPSQELEVDFLDDYTKKCSRNKGGLILVTSLIDKIPNLGGLCRTSEIFGVSEFVLGNLRYVEDKSFQNLSVTAQKWLNVTEVQAQFLTRYLLEMKQEGYMLVGAEQTANSISLTEFKFPHKTLLLLGNEKEGIPVNLIQLLDACVEIPQQGIIRSLNVHVCGALLVWEYTRQQMKL